MIDLRENQLYSGFQDCGHCLLYKAEWTRCRMVQDNAWQYLTEHLRTDNKSNGQKA